MKRVCRDIPIHNDWPAIFRNALVFMINYKVSILMDARRASSAKLRVLEV